jgi:hypothetical protein
VEPKPQDGQKAGNEFVVSQDFQMNGVLYSLNGCGNTVRGKKEEVLLKSVFLPWKTFLIQNTRHPHHNSSAPI